MLNFESLKIMTSFEQISEPGFLADVPDDYFVMITDVRHSREAIASGKYREINMIGAASIACLTRRFGLQAMPYVFGGDGASFLIPSALVHECAEILLGLADFARKAFSFELRVGAVAVRDLRADGYQLQYGKIYLSKKLTQAVFAGNGFQIADRFIKDPQEANPYLCVKSPNNPKLEPDFTGLNCRWQRIASHNGFFVSLLISHTKSLKIYTKILQFIETNFGHAIRPVSFQNLKLNLKWSAYESEANLYGQGRILKKLKYQLGTWFTALLGHVLFRYQIRLGNFDFHQYFESLLIQTDYRKIDGFLRMTIDVSDAQWLQLESYLTQLEERGEIYFGEQVSEKAIMTCLVYDFEANHVHFLDGEHGGYTKAYQKLEDKLKQATHLQSPIKVTG